MFLKLTDRQQGAIYINMNKVRYFRKNTIEQGSYIELNDDFHHVTETPEEIIAMISCEDTRQIYPWSVVSNQGTTLQYPDEERPHIKDTEGED